MECTRQLSTDTTLPTGTATQPISLSLSKRPRAWGLGALTTGLMCGKHAAWIAGVARALPSSAFRHSC